MAKKVMLVLEVPDGEYCFGLDGTQPPCQYFNFSSGYAQCDHSFTGQKEVSDGYLKSPKCASLPAHDAKKGVLS